MLVVHVISDKRKGGAEAVVQSIVSYKYSEVPSKAIYFSSSDQDLSHEMTLHCSPRNVISIFKLRKIFKSILKKERVIIVHVHLTWPFLYVPIASLGLNVKLIYTEHSTFNKRRNYTFFRFIDAFFYSRYIKVVGISDAVSNSLKDWLGIERSKSITTIHNGVDLLEIKSRSNIENKSKIKLLSVGSLKKLKGFETTIKSLVVIRDVVESYTIVGSGPDLDKLKKIADDYGVNDLVVFAGWSDDLEPYYHGADILLIPSHWEGFGLVAVEGMSCGISVIASNVDGLNEVVSPSLLSAILIDDFMKPDEWSIAIMKMRKALISSGDLMCSCSRKQAENFDIKNMIHKYENLYNSLVKL